MRRFFKPVLALHPGLLAFFLVVFSSPDLLLAQGEGRGPNGEDLRFVNFTSIKVAPSEKVKNSYTIEIRAKTNALPHGTRVDFLLTCRSQTIETYTEEVPGNKSISSDFIVKNVHPGPDKYMFRTVIDLKKQPTAVRKQIEKDKKRFPPAGNPWTEFHFENQFNIGTAAEIAEEVAEIRTWFVSRYTELATLDGKVAANVKGIEEGTSSDFLGSDGTFDEKKWRKWFDKKAVERLIEIQKEIKTSFVKPRFSAHRLVLANLSELTNSVAWRSVDKSVKLYRSLDLKPNPTDLKPEELEIEVRSSRRRVPRKSDLRKLLEKINTLLGIGGQEGS